jgi:hypothetical protein
MYKLHQRNQPPHYLITLPTLTLCWEIKTQNGGMVGHQTIRRREKCSKRVSHQLPPPCIAIPLTIALAKRMSHEANSLPQLVENLVKNWEVEASFKPNLDDWRTVDRENYSFAINGGAPQTAEHMLQQGTYNAIIAPNEYYSPEYSDFASSHKTFKRMMPNFAWEVLEVYSGPPTVSFRWRHWGVMKNDYVGFNKCVLILL